MANFFNEITAPQLNSTEYGKGIQEMVDNINNNFQKVFTLPFLKGDDGDMISTEFCPFWVKNDGDTDYYLTQEGAKIFNTIFETTKTYLFKGGMTYEEFKNVLINDLNLYSNSKSYNNISLFNELYGPDKDPKILLFYKISSEDGVSETPLGSAQLYYYFDPRISKLSELITISNHENTNTNENNSNNENTNPDPSIDYRQTFRDYTCILSTRYDSDGNYTYEKQSGWPTLYFDNNSKQFCWLINGQKTGVNAQGVNGKDGIGARIWVCQVEIEQEQNIADFVKKGLMSEFKIKLVYVPSKQTWRVPGDTLKSELGEINYFQLGDMAVCYFEYDEGKEIVVPIIKTDEDGNPIKNDNGDYEYETISMNIYTDQMIGVINQKTSGNKDFFVQSCMSQNLANMYENLILYNLFNNIGVNEIDSTSTPQIKGLFIPTHDESKNIHALYEGGFNKDDNNKTDNPGDLYLVKTNVKNIKTNGGYISHNTNTTNPNFNVYYNTNIYGKTTLSSTLNVTGTTTLSSTLNVTGTTTLAGDLVVSPDSSINLGLTDYNTPDQCGISYNKDGEKNLCFYGGYDSVFGNYNLIPIIKSIRYLNNNGNFEMANRIRFRNSGTLIYDKLFIGSNDNIILNMDKNPLFNPDLFVDGGALITGKMINNKLVGGLTVGTENIPAPTTLYGKLTVKSGAAITGDLTVSGTTTLSGKLTVTSNGATIFGDILPGDNAKYNLGSDSTNKGYKWNNVYANTFNGALSGNASSASKLTLSKDYGSENKPVYFTESGVPIECNLYAGGTRLNINGNSYTSSGTIYAPTLSGDSGQILVSTGSAPIWSSGNVGTDTTPVYMSGGKITKCGRSAGFIYWATDSLDAWSEGLKVLNQHSYYPNVYCPHFYINMLNVEQNKYFEFPSDLYLGNVMITLRLANASNKIYLYPDNKPITNNGVYHIYFDNKETTVKVNDVDKTFRNIFEVVQIA